MVTFGGSSLDRAAELRADAAQMATLLAAGWVVPIWRGKPLIENGQALGWLRADNVVFQGGEPAIFLGMDDRAPRFAQDISHWLPESGIIQAGVGFPDSSQQRHPALAERFAFEDLRGVMAALTPRDAELVAMGKAMMQWHRSHGFCAACGAASLPSHAGWQRTCPACAAHHFPRTDPVVIMLVERDNCLLLGRSSGWPEGMYSLLAGFVEPGEPLEAAVRREVAEETGIQVGAVRYLASQPWPFPSSLMFGCHAQAVSSQITVDPSELEDARWVPREEILRVMAGQHPTIKAGRKGAIAHFLITNWLADRTD